jgi:hypothetical protein
MVAGPLHVMNVMAVMPFAALYRTLPTMLVSLGLIGIPNPSNTPVCHTTARCTDVPDVVVGSLMSTTFPVQVHCLLWQSRYAVEVCLEATHLNQLFANMHLPITAVDLDLFCHFVMVIFRQDFSRIRTIGWFHVPALLLT